MTARGGMRPSGITEGNVLGSLHTGKFLGSKRVIMKLFVTLGILFICVFLFVCLMSVCKTGLHYAVLAILHLLRKTGINVCASIVGIHHHARPNSVSFGGG